MEEDECCDAASHAPASISTQFVWHTNSTVIKAKLAEIPIKLLDIGIIFFVRRNSTAINFSIPSTDELNRELWNQKLSLHTADRLANFLILKFILTLFRLNIANRRRSKVENSSNLRGKKYRISPGGKVCFHIFTYRIRIFFLRFSGSYLFISHT